MYKSALKLHWTSTEFRFSWNYIEHQTSVIQIRGSI